MTYYCESINTTPWHLPTYHLKSGKWSRKEDQGALLTVHRRTLFQAFYGNPDNVCVIDANRVEDVAKSLAYMSVTKSSKGWTLDGATGSRKKGQFIGVNGDPYSTRYFSGSKRISHYSILFSQCQSLYRHHNVRVVVVDDGLVENQDRYRVGDCHGRISWHLVKAMGGDSRDNRVIQFRAGVKDEWVAKGTVMPSRNEQPINWMQQALMAAVTYQDVTHAPQLLWIDTEGFHQEVDLILPLSSFKGNKLPLNTVIELPELVFGIQQRSRKLTYSVSHSVAGWFGSDSSRAYLRSLTINRMEELLSVRQDLPGLVKLFVESRFVDEQGNRRDIDDVYSDPELNDQQRAMYRYAWILKHDRHGILSRHPKTVAWANQAMRVMVKEAALGSTLQASGLMACPFPALPHGVVVSCDLPHGTYLMWRYPIRHYGDILKVKVYNLYNPESLAELKSVCPKWEVYHQSVMPRQPLKGCFWINPDYFLVIGGDFDGDFGCFLNTQIPIACPIDKNSEGDREYLYGESALSLEHSQWTPIPELVKPPKSEIQGSLFEIAAASTSNLVGKISWMMAACRLLRMTGEYSKLGQEIQIAVDSFKSGLSNDLPYLEKLEGVISERLKANDNCWLYSYKNRDAYVTAPISCDWDDTISELVREVNGYWLDTSLEFQPLPTQSFASMFDWIRADVPASWLERARTKRHEYGIAINKIRQEMTKQKKEDQQLFYKQQLFALNESYVEIANRITDPDIRLKACAAFHLAFHGRNGSSSYSRCSVVFAMFPDIYRDVLQHDPISKFRIQILGEKATATAYHNATVNVSIQLDDEGNTSVIDSVTGEVIGNVITTKLTQGNGVPVTGSYAIQINTQYSSKGRNMGLPSYHQCNIVSTHTVTAPIAHPTIDDAHVVPAIVATSSYDDDYYCDYSDADIECYAVAAA